MKNKLLLLFVLIATLGYAQNVTIPDANFKTFLVDNIAINTNGDSEIQVSEAIAYTGILACQGRNISSLTGIEFFPNIEGLTCHNNQLTSIDVSGNPSLENLTCSQNQLTSLDLSANTAITSIDCRDNQLTSFNIANGNNISITFINATNNPNLTCIEVDLATVAISPGAWQIDAIATYSASCTACTVNIPDANFKAYLVGNTAINTNGDTEIQCSEATAFTGQIYCATLNISDLTGIEAFTSLTALQCPNNQLMSLDISANTALTVLDCSNNPLTSLDVSSNTALITLACNNNQLTNLDVSANIALTTFYCNTNQLTSLDVSANIALTTLECFSNILTTLNVSTNTALAGLKCSNNQLTTLDVSGNTALSRLYCNANQLISLDVSGNTALSWLYCGDNQLTTLDVSANTALLWLYCENNQLATLDVSGNTVLTRLVCNDNQLTSLNIANGNNTNITQLITTNNTVLSCIEVDAAIVGTSPASWFKDSWTNYNANCASICNVNIPDANFKAYLVGNTAINTNGDIEIQCSEASAFTGIISCSGQSITDITGIEAFTALTVLHCNYNQLTSLDVSANTALTVLHCRNNQLTSLDVSANTALSDLRFDNNQLTSLDVSANTALITLAGSFNQLTSLDVSANTALENLHLYDNPVTSIDVSANTALIQLELGFTSITSIDVSTNTALQGLYFNDAQITSIDVSNNTALKWVYFENNQLTSLDLSAQPNLEELTCYNNQLTSLNVANGNNANMYYFDAINNTALTCIEVDAATVATPPAGWYKDAGATYSATCTTCTVNIPDANFKAYLVGNTAINTNGDTEIQCSEASAFTGEIFLYNLGISDLTGVEAFTALTQLTAANNQLTSLDVSANIALEILSANSNQLTSLDVSANIALEELFCNGNQLTSLDVSTNTALNTLYCNDNQLTSLDVSAHSDLVLLVCNDNQLTSLNIANGNNANMFYFDAQNNAGLTCIEVDAAIVGTSPTDWYKDATASYSANCGSLSVDDFSLNTVSIYPNPATSVLNIKMNQSIKQTTVYSMLGKEVLRTQNNTVDVSGLSNGVYVITIEAENGNTSTKRFIKK